IEEEKDEAARQRSKGVVVTATVKGDVHDIGKNIVGVVLQCNNYDVVDLGVMVPTQQILDKAREVNADVIGLSGLITPSLDEMVRVASEMQRQGFEVPLLLGGATTSRAHTAVKVDGRYDGPVVWVKDASRSVPVVSQLLSEDQRPVFLEGVDKEYDSIRARHAAKSTERPLAPLADARAAAPAFDWATHRPMRPHLLAQQAGDRWSGPSDGHWHRAATQFTRVFDDVPVAELRPYIDWTPFFSAWEIKGRYPDVVNNPATADAARRLYDDAQRMLDRMEREHWISARGVAGIFPAASVGDDLEVYTDEARGSVLTTLHHLRQQGRHRDGVPNKCLADVVAPRDSGVADHVGAFSVTTGLGLEDRLAAFKADLDDYSAILLESLADRLAEAFAERLHQRVRRELWGYAPDERLDAAGLIAERYRGIRPAPGYPACPDHTEKLTLMALLGGEERTGVKLTESMAMWPGASVSGWYFAHPESQYFVVGRLGRDQVEDYAARKGWDLRTAERWLAPNLGYQPDD
ncbi:MAG: vitamin B12 dependent-methionine synthase activation domain-containing protein, partial [Dermatophilaceae bacterium]